jgi:hypothetical protein
MTLSANAYPENIRRRCCMTLERTMNSMSWSFATPAERVRSRQEILMDHRSRIAIEEEARAQQRRLALAEQCSDSNPPEERIRTWEKLHGLRMPSDPDHAILLVIAVNTRLRSCDVHEVQAARTRRTAAAAPIVSIAPEPQPVDLAEAKTT